MICYVFITRNDEGDKLVFNKDKLFQAGARDRSTWNQNLGLVVISSPLRNF